MAVQSVSIKWLYNKWMRDKISVAFFSPSLLHSVENALLKVNEKPMSLSGGCFVALIYRRKGENYTGVNIYANKSEVSLFY